jgi:hypothetical protein
MPLRKMSPAPGTRLRTIAEKGSRSRNMAPMPVIVAVPAAV